MSTVDLDTTNTFLGIMAVVSVLEAVLLIGLAVGGYMAYRRVMQLLAELEARQIAPIRQKVDGILSDVRSVTANVSHQSERVHHAINGTMDRVDETAGRVKGTVHDKMNQAVGVARGIRAFIMTLIGADRHHEPPAPAAGRAV